MKGSEVLLQSLLAEGVDTVFGYPGGQIMTVYDTLHGYSDSIRHILVRHEQGAIHAAQGYARASGKTGVVTVTSGPGATNVVTGLVDAMMDSTPVVVVAGQVGNDVLGTDAFQEADFLGITLPITKWSCQVKTAQDIAPTIARAFYIARSGRPGPVVVVLTRDAQNGSVEEFNYTRRESLTHFKAIPVPGDAEIQAAADMINSARNPFLVYGQGIILSGAEKKLERFLSATDIPAGSTMLGLSALPAGFPQYTGMLGMHGNIAPNQLTQTCDLLISVGMRFDDRVTGRTDAYSPQSKKIHIDIDQSELNKNVRVDLGVCGDAGAVLDRLLPLVKRNEDRADWREVVARCNAAEDAAVVAPEVRPTEGTINMGEVVEAVRRECGNSAIVVTDVGQNQLITARYSAFDRTRSFLTSGGLGTMGFGIPAAIGAKIAVPERPVCLFVGDGGLQMTIEEFGVIMQEHLGVKMVLLNNNWLGNVRQWQQLFYGGRYSHTRMMNPNFKGIAEAYAIRYRAVEAREELADAVREMLADDEPWLLDVHVTEMGMVFPMVPPGKSIGEIMLNEKEWFSYGE